jgi:hypothetical protein
MITAKEIIKITEAEASPVTDIITYFFNQARQSRRAKIVNINNSIHVKEMIEVPPDELNDIDVNSVATKLIQAFLSKVSNKLQIKLISNSGGNRYLFGVIVPGYSEPPIKAVITFNPKLNSNLMIMCESDIWLDAPYISNATMLTDSVKDKFKATINAVFQYFNPTFKSLAYA